MEIVCLGAVGDRNAGLTCTQSTTPTPRTTVTLPRPSSRRRSGSRPRPSRSSHRISVHSMQPLQLILADLFVIHLRGSLIYLPLTYNAIRGTVALFQTSTLDAATCASSAQSRHHSICFRFHPANVVSCVTTHLPQITTILLNILLTIPLTTKTL